MSFKPQTLASVRSYYFREALADRSRTRITGRYETLDDFRPYWREANIKANEMMRRMSNRYDPKTATWSNPK